MNTRYDMPDNYYFGGGADSSVITPFALLGLVIAIGVIFWVPRRQIIIPLLCGSLLLPFGISLVAFGLHFPTLRVLLVAGWLRYAMRRDLVLPELNSIDKALLAWALSNAIAFSIIWGNSAAITNRLAFLWDTLGSYIFVRMLIRDKEDVALSIRMLAVVLTVIAPAMVIEHVTRYNLFAILGAPELSDIRYGAIRARGPFAHAIIAGTIGAVTIPLLVGLWWEGKRNRALLFLGIVSGLVMAVASASSTPLMTCGAGVFGLSLWGARKHVRTLRRVLVLSVLGLHFCMKAPVWMLVARTGGAIGGSGYHRAMLIDNFIRHFSEWWLLGTRTNADWGFDMWDVDNAFVAAGINGGLLAFIAFMILLVNAFRQLAQSRRFSLRSIKDQRLIWAIGACLFANIVGFFGIVYFDQSVLVWYLLLAMVSATAAFPVEKSRDFPDSDNGKFRGADNTVDGPVSPWQTPATV